MASLILIIIVPVAVGLITHEIIVYAADIAKWFVGRAVRKLEPKHQAAYSAEWLAIVDDIRGPLAKIWFALHMNLFGAKQMQRMLRPKLHPYFNRKVRIVAEACWFVALNISTAHRVVPAVLKAAALGRWQNIRFLFLSQRLLIGTMMLSHARKDPPAERDAALDKAQAQIRAIIEKKSPSNETANH